MMEGCSECKTNFVALVGGRRVCYYCGQGIGTYDPVITEIPLGDSLGDAITPNQIVMIDDPFLDSTD